MTTITLVPLVCAVFIPAYHYFTSPGRILLQGYSLARQTEDLDISERDWDKIYSTLRRMPPDVEAALIVRSAVIVSTIPDLPAGTALPDRQLWDFIKSTGSEYFYQFETPPIGPRENRIAVISRVNRNRERMRRDNGRVLSWLIFAILFIAACVTAASAVYRTIYKSILLLKKQMQSIADGNLAVKISTKQDRWSSNEITSMSGSLEKMRESLHEAQNRRLRLIMGISHDLRTPVAVIKGYTEALLDNMMGSQEEADNALRLIGTKTDQLENMIDTLINYVKLDSRDWRENLLPEPLAPFISEFVRNAESTGAVFRRVVTSSVRISPDLKVSMNRQLALRALENIYNNALRYTKDGDSIRITAEEKPDCVTVSVADTGCGIDGKDIDHIFDLFYRGTASRREEGMGIGLSVVKNIMDIHGWTISVTSRKDFGTEFVITIPKGNE